MSPTEQQLKEDERIRNRLDELERLGLRFDPKYAKEYDDLHHEYYIKNHDIRMYWKTY